MPVREKEYILFCDESVKEGPYYSNFYGGVLVAASSFQAASARLNDCKQRLNLHGEVKWQKVTEPYLQKYCDLVDAFFDELQAGRAKVRIMFRQNARRPRGLTPPQVEQGFYILYYQFIKHAFGFAGMPEHAEPVHLRLYFDQLPDTGEQVARFRGYILGLNASRESGAAKLSIRPEDFTEVRSHDHVLLQCVDVVLGAMAFRLNDMHRQKVPGTERRGSRTKAKEKLYDHIVGRIRGCHPRFNIGITTGGGNVWAMPYRHWEFVPTEHEYDNSLTKQRGAKKKPADPT